MSLVVRPARPEDAPETLRILAEAAASRRHILRQPEELPTLDEEAAAIRGINEKGTFLVALLDGRIVGTATAHPGHRRANAHVAEVGIAVAESHRGRGVGRALMESLEAWAREAGVRKLALGVYADNAPALALYRGLGYEEEGVRRGQYILEGREVDEVLMAKRVPP